MPEVREGFKGRAVVGRPPLVVRGSPSGKGCYASSLDGATGLLARHPIFDFSLCLIALFLSQWRKCGKERSDSSAA